MHECVICGDTEKDDIQLRHPTCGQHSMCDSCLNNAFRLALHDERQYPPRCCNTGVFLIDEVPDQIDVSLIFDYKLKEREYRVQPRFRTYCANASCARFIHPEHHIGTEAYCESCLTLTCTKCKVRITLGDLFEKPSSNSCNPHVCVAAVADLEFKLAAAHYGYKQCPNCASTIELAEACNHITCDCGTAFCYICGRIWEEVHGCPMYGPAVYDAEGFNQTGYHRDTGLNREGQTWKEASETTRADRDRDEIDAEAAFNQAEETRIAADQTWMARAIQQFRDAAHTFAGDDDMNTDENDEELDEDDEDEDDGDGEDVPLHDARIGGPEDLGGGEPGVDYYRDRNGHIRLSRSDALLGITSSETESSSSDLEDSVEEEAYDDALFAEHRISIAHGRPATLNPVSSTERPIRLNHSNLRVVPDHNPISIPIRGRHPLSPFNARAHMDSPIEDPSPEALGAFDRHNTRHPFTPEYLRALSPGAGDAGEEERDEAQFDFGYVDEGQDEGEHEEEQEEYSGDVDMFEWNHGVAYVSEDHEFMDFE